MTSPPFSTVSATDHQAGLWIVCGLSGIYSLAILACRYGVRRKFTVADGVLLAGYVFAIISWILLVNALFEGTGKAASALSAASLAAAARLTYGSVITLLLAIACAMASQCLFLLEVVSLRWHAQLCYGTAAITSILGIVALLCISAGCSSTRYLNSELNAACHNQDSRWEAFAICLSVACCIPTFLPIYLFHNLQISWGRKLNLLVVFSPSLLNITFIVLAAHYARQFAANGVSSRDTVPYLVCLEVILLWAFLGATLPAVRPLAIKFTTVGLILTDDTRGATRGSGSGNQLSTYRTRLSGRGSQNRSILASDELQLRDDTNNDYQVFITTRRRAEETASVASFGSQRQFIHKTVETQVEFDEAGPPYADDVSRAPFEPHKF